MAETDISGYSYSDADRNCAHKYLLPGLKKALATMDVSPKKLFDLGCGNGAIAHWWASQGYEVAGVDPSSTGIAEANRAYPELKLHVGSAYDQLHVKFGTFPLVTSLEVIEHVYAPRLFARCVCDLLEPGGYVLISTPYHGYVKNLALAVTGRMDAHFTALWDHGHIKFWSVVTITQLLSEVGLNVRRVLRLGRVPQLAKSMLIVAQKS